MPDEQDGRGGARLTSAQRLTAGAVAALGILLLVLTGDTAGGHAVPMAIGQSLLTGGVVGFLLADGRRG